MFLHQPVQFLFDKAIPPDAGWMIYNYLYLPFIANTCITGPSILSPLDTLTRQLEAEIQAVKNNQDLMLREIIAMTPTTVLNDWFPSAYQRASFVYDASDAIE